MFQCVSTVLALGTTERSLVPSSLHPLLRDLYTLLRSSLSLFSRLTSASSLSLSSPERCLRPFLIFMTFHLTVSSMSMSLLYRGIQNQTQHSTCGLTSAEYRGKPTSLDLLATHCLLKPRTPSDFFAARAHSWLMFKLASTRMPRSCSATLLSSWVARSTSWCLRLFLFALLVELDELLVSPTPPA